MGQDDSKVIGRIVPNIGKTGLVSIRIGGMALDTLAMAEAAITKLQWRDVKASNERQEVENILSKYPKAKIAYLESRVVECEENIVRIQQLIVGQNTMINEYSGHIGLCKHRDKEIAKLGPDATREDTKALRLQFPPYDVEAMQTQIGLCQEAIERSDKVIKQEFDSIAELKQAITQCLQRDSELLPYGVKVG